eukprot:271135-Karenia_brevis.AAC.1
MLMSRAVTRRRRDGRYRKLMFIDVKKAHLSSRCEENVYLELPQECNCPEGFCGKLNFWMYGMRSAASAWERHYAEKFEGMGFERERDLKWVRKHMVEWYEIK